MPTACNWVTHQNSLLTSAEISLLQAIATNGGCGKVGDALASKWTVHDSIALMFAGQVHMLCMLHAMLLAVLLFHTMAPASCVSAYHASGVSVLFADIRPALPCTAPPLPPIVSTTLLQPPRALPTLPETVQPSPQVLPRLRL
jgi:hypothetical protein